MMVLPTYVTVWTTGAFLPLKCVMTIKKDFDMIAMGFESGKKQWLQRVPLLSVDALVHVVLCGPCIGSINTITLGHLM